MQRVNSFQKAVDSIKLEFWHTTDVILHSRDIRKCSKQFKILIDNEVKRQFYRRINDVLAEHGIYVIICCSVLKEDCISRYGTDTDIYGIALKYVLQRSVFCVDDNNPSGGKINIIVERRGKREDAALAAYYNRLRVTGMHYVSPQRLAMHMGRFGFSDKKKNIFGLQVADLIAYPISRHVLSPEKPNLAFDVIRPNIYASDGKLLGLKIYPDK